jgi:hypothetical protein
MSLSVQELLRRADIAYVENARGGKYTTKCPHCGGGYLNVKIENGTVCWFCHGCGRGGPEPQPKPSANNGLGPIKACYDYTDELGRRLFQVLRFEPVGRPKKFFQRTGPDQEEWSIKGVRLVLFKLPELIEDLAQEHTVFVVEGEKDVLTLRRHNIPATTNPMGAQKWRPEFNQFFAGADVIVVGDHDEPGRDHVRKVAANLAPVVKRLRVLELAAIWPGIKPGDDVTDWFEYGGGTAEALWAAVERLRDYVVAETDPVETDPVDIGAADFVAHMPTHRYIFKPSGELWPASSVNSRIPPIPIVDASGQPVLDDKGKQKFLPASTWLDRNQPVEQMSWTPGQPQLIENRLISQGGWIKQPGCTVFNLYRPPILVPKAGNYKKWRDHMHRVFPSDADHIERVLAHRVQRPAEKINHALVFVGLQGIGKDTLLVPVRYAVGPWNFIEVTPRHVLGRFNGFLKSVILRINEARDLGDFDRYAFYDHMKAYTAAHQKCCASTRRTYPSTIFPISAASSSPATTRPTASICRPMIAATSSLGRRSPRKTSRPNTGPISIAITPTAALPRSPPI